jgi:hypothetical protein
LLYSAQRSGNTKPGPKYFRPQYKIGNGVWKIIPGMGRITLANDWSGVIDGLPLPSECFNQTDSVFIRWLMVTNEAINGYPVLATGITKIDEILILGTPISVYNKEIFRQNDIIVSPTMSTGIFNIFSANEISEINVLDSKGSFVKSFRHLSYHFKLDLTGQPEGIYLFILLDSKGNMIKTEKILIIND